MDRDRTATWIDEPVWETPSVEEISVSAEATAYMGVKDDWD
jgi:coenzyme PQQ precursor peptide PqqA